jgi:phosphonate ABC transporter ATP-binding protein/phosphonate ABC transporter permease subunit PhnE
MIEIRALTKAYGDIPALRGVDLRVSAGELCVVLGPSGAGKSTLLRCVNRLTEPTSGEILIAGKPAPRNRADLRDLRRHIGMIFQDHNLVPRLSVLKNVLTGRLATMPSIAAALQVFPRVDIDIALDALRRVDLAERAYDRADRLSGGQQQRVGIARALAQQPQVILADEPVASLDPKTARVVLDDLRRAAHELGIAVLCNLHQVEYAVEFADRIVGICDGRVVFEGAPAQLGDAALARIYARREAKISRAPSTGAPSDRMTRFRLLLGGPWPVRRGLKWVALLAAATAVLGWSAQGVGLNVSDLLRGLPWIGDLLSRMVPPNWVFFGRLVKPVIETVQIAIWGTLLSVLLALPLCFLAARNLSPSLAVFHVTRQALNALRGINEIIFALIFVAAVGLGPFAGVLALSIHGAGMLGKFFAEAVEEIDAGPVEALRATGTRPTLVAIFAVLPQVIPSWIASTLYRFEVNLRAATILGIIGAGGIGFELVSSLKLFQYEDTATCVLVILAMVMTADYLSSRLRARILTT